MPRKIMICTIALGLFSTPAMAQISDYHSSHSFGSTYDQIGITSGVKLTVPFNTKTYSKKESARLGFTLSLDNHSQRQWAARPATSSANLLELGFFENDEPNIMLMGQNIYDPLFRPTKVNAKSANGAGESKKSNTVLYIAGGAALLAGLTVALASEASDNLVNCDFSTDSNLPQCR